MEDKFSLGSNLFPNQRTEPTGDETSPFSNLPDEKLMEIFSYLTHQELCSNRLVCKRWDRVSPDQDLWKEHVKKIFYNPDGKEPETLDEEILEFDMMRKQNAIEQLFEDLVDDFTKANKESKVSEYLFYLMKSMDLNSEVGQKFFFKLVEKLADLNPQSVSDFFVFLPVTQFVTQFNIKDEDSKINFVKWYIEKHGSRSGGSFDLIKYFEIQSEEAKIKLLEHHATQNSRSFMFEFNQADFSFLNEEIKIRLATICLNAMSIDILTIPPEYDMFPEKFIRDKGVQIAKFIDKLNINPREAVRLINILDDKVQSQAFMEGIVEHLKSHNDQLASSLSQLLVTKEICKQRNIPFIY